MRVLHVIPAVASKYGGPSTAIVSMTKAMDRNGIDVSVATTDAGLGDDQKSLEDTFGSVPVHCFTQNCSETWKVSLELRRWLMARVREYDLLHIHAVWSFASTVSARFCVQYDVPYILRPAGMLSAYSWQHKGWKKRLYWSILENKTVDGAAAFHATSDGEKHDIGKLTDKADVFVIPNGVEDEAFTYQENLRPGFPSVNEDAPSDVPVILFMSRLHPKKGIIDRLLPAISKLRQEFQLMIVGNEDSHYPGYESEVVSAIRNLKLSERVKLLGPTTGNERWNLYDAADLFVLPSHSENFGIVVAEAMSRGCPVITTDQVQSAPHVKLAGAGSVVSGDAEELARAIGNLLDNRELRSAMSARGIEYANEYFRWDVIGNKIITMYNDVLASTPSLRNEQRKQEQV